MNVALIIPVYNEGDRCVRLLEQISSYKNFFLECFLVDDGSKNKRYLDALSCKYSWLHVIKLKRNRGKGAAMRVGLEYAMLDKIDAVIFIDGDGQHPANLVPKFSQELLKNKLVFGYRYFSEVMPIHRKLGNILVRKIVNVFFNIKRKDLLCGFFGFRTEIIKEILWSSDRYGVETEIATRVGKLRIPFKEVEIPTIYLHKYKGVTLMDGIKILLKIPSWYFS